MDFQYNPYAIPLNNAWYAADDITNDGVSSCFDERQLGFPSSPGFPGFHGGLPSQPPSFPPGGGGQQGGPPSSPPPFFTPQAQQQGVSVFAVDPGAIRGCLFRFTYIWLDNGRSFWFYPTFVGRNSVSGWRWSRFRWVYYGTDLRRINNFQCF